MDPKVLQILALMRSQTELVTQIANTYVLATRNHAGMNLLIHLRDHHQQPWDLEHMTKVRDKYQNELAGYQKKMDEIGKKIDQLVSEATKVAA